MPTQQITRPESASESPFRDHLWSVDHIRAHSTLPGHILDLLPITPRPDTGEPAFHDVARSAALRLFQEGEASDLDPAAKANWLDVELHMLRQLVALNIHAPQSQSNRPNLPPPTKPQNARKGPSCCPCRPANWRRRVICLGVVGAGCGPKFSSAP